MTAAGSHERRSDPWDDPRVQAGTARLLARRRELLDGGAAPIGWKLAFGTPQATESLGLSGPVVGFLTDATRLADGGEIEVGGWKAPKLEAEVAMLVGADGGLERIAAAIELADADRPPAELEEVLAGDIYHRAVLIGEPSERPAGPLAVAVERDGEEVAATADGEATTGRLDDLVAWVGRYLERFGEELRPGEAIISGSTVPLIDIAAGEQWTVRLAGVGELAVSLK